MADVEQKPLTQKEERFCQEYTVDYRKEAAAKRAGYAEKSAAKTACRLMKDPRILARIDEIQKELCEQLKISRERVVLGLQHVADACMAAKPVMRWDYAEHKWVESGTYRIDAAGATKALVAIGKHLGMFAEKGDEAIGGSGPVFYTGVNEIKE